MKRLSNIALLCCIASTLILASCSSSTTPAPDKNYFPLTVGNSWTYDGVETEDKSGTATDIDSTKYTSTTTVDAALTYQGKSAYRMVRVTSDGTKDTSYISKSGSQMYSYIALNPGDGGGAGAVGDVDFGSRWMLVADYNATSWTILDTTITNIPFDVGGGTILTGKAGVKISGSKGSVVSISVGTETVQAQEFTMTVGMTITITVPLLGDQVIPINVIQKTYVAENIGIVKTETLPFSITAVGNTSASNGNRETLKTYEVVK